MKYLIIYTALILCLKGSVMAQLSVQKSGTYPYYASFVDYQKTFVRPDESFRRKEDTLEKQFIAKGLKWPAKYIYIRSFKYDSQLEVWVKDEINDPFKLFKTYKICVLAGTLGPKRMEGDYQVPEGFYYINEFNPRSTYYLSLGINYPNASDRILSDSLTPGSGIYIHGSCVSVGCIPITDESIDEVYILAAHAKSQGQDYIPVHIFPVRFNVSRSVNYLNSIMKDDPALKKFAARLEDAFDYFDKYKQLPVIMINEQGEYIVNSVPVRKIKGDKDEKPVKKTAIPHRQRNVTGFVTGIHHAPEYLGGGDAFMKYLAHLGKEMVSFLPVGIKKAYVQVEFIVDIDGVPTNFKMLRSVNDEDFDDELISRMEKMPEWKPALLNDKPVPMKMVQTVTIELAQ